MKNILILIIALSYFGFSQSVELKRIDASEYPKIKAQIEITDENGNDVSLQNRDSISITDGDVTGIVPDSLSCATNEKRFSLIIVVDFSKSMSWLPNQDDVQGSPGASNRRFDAVQRAIKRMVSFDPQPLIQLDKHELAIFSFNSSSTYQVHFTQDYENRELSSFVDDVKPNSIFKGVTRYDAAFTGYGDPDDGGNPRTGRTLAGFPNAPIPYVSFGNARYKPIIFFMTDGAPDDGDGGPETNVIKGMLDDLDITVFSAYFGNVSWAGMSTLTNPDGKIYPSLNTEQEIVSAIEDMIRIVENSDLAIPPCDIEWTADCSAGEGTISVDIDGTTVSTNFEYQEQIDAVKPTMEIQGKTDKVELEFINRQSRNIKITSVNNNLVVDDVTSNSPLFTFTGATSANLGKRQNLNVTLNLDLDAVEECTTVDFVVESNACEPVEVVAEIGVIKPINVDMGQLNPGESLAGIEHDFLINNTCKSFAITNVKSGDNDIFPIEVLPNTINILSSIDTIFIPESTTFWENPPSQDDIDVGLVDNSGTFEDTVKGEPVVITNFQSGTLTSSTLTTSTITITSFDIISVFGITSNTFFNSNTITVSNFNSTTTTFPIINPGETFKLPLFGFVPPGVDSYDANLFIEINQGKIPMNVGKIRGRTQGSAEIETVLNGNSPILTCNETAQITINVENTGQSPMAIDEVVITDTNGYFTLLTNPEELAVGENGDILIQFAPDAEGNFAALVDIRSNATESSRTISIDGSRQNVEYEITGNSNDLHDVGTICAGETVNVTLGLNNLGELAQELVFSSSFNAVNFNNGTNWTSGDFNLQLDANEISESPFNLVVAITDACGDLQDEITIVGTIDEATADWTNTDQFETSINDPLTVTLTVQTNYSRDLDNLVVTKLDANQFFTDVSLAQTTVVANGTIDLNVTYNPDQSSTDELNVNISGEANGTICLSQNLSARIFGTDQPRAEAVTDQADYSGFIGDPFDLIISFDNPQNNFNNVVTDVVMNIIVDTDLLEIQGLTGVDQGNNRTSYPITVNVANPQSISVLPLNSGVANDDVSLIEVEFVRTIPDVGFVVPTSANFTLMKSEGRVTIDDLTAAPGERVTFTISEQDFTGLSSLHQRISGDLRFNATLLIPTDQNLIDQSTFENEGTADVKRLVPFELILTSTKKGSNKTQADPIKLEFEALLGNAFSTEMEIINLTTVAGVSNITPINGEFILEDVCEDENGNIIRLFDSFAPTTLNVDGDNPTNSTSTIRVNLLEDGLHSLKMINSTGQTKQTFIDGNISHGYYHFNINASEYRAGKYFIILETPTRVFTQELIIVK